MSSHRHSATATDASAASRCRMGLRQPPWRPGKLLDAMHAWMLDKGTQPLGGRSCAGAGVWPTMPGADLAGGWSTSTSSGQRRRSAGPAGVGRAEQFTAGQCGRGTRAGSKNRSTCRPAFGFVGNFSKGAEISPGLRGHGRDAQDEKRPFAFPETGRQTQLATPPRQEDVYACWAARRRMPQGRDGARVFVGLDGELNRRWVAISQRDSGTLR